jgi:predicted nuclease of restriction endonuclease-like (RecB) superfamily
MPCAAAAMERLDSLAKWRCSPECTVSCMAAKTSTKKPAARINPASSKSTELAGLARRTTVDRRDKRFAEVVALIEAARGRAYQAVNAELVAHYWELGEYISRKIANAEWGDGVVEELAADLARRYPGVRGYTRPNLFRMRQFYEAYRSNRKVSPLVRQLPWTHHLIILSQAKPVESREFYILAATKERWTKRELERQIRSGAVLREALATKKVSPAVRQTHPTAIDEFKNAYNVEFLGLAAEHSEADLHGALLRNLGRFLTELGRDVSASWRSS